MNSNCQGIDAANPTCKEGHKTGATARLDRQTQPTRMPRRPRPLQTPTVVCLSRIHAAIIPFMTSEVLALDSWASGGSRARPVLQLGASLPSGRSLCGCFVSMHVAKWPRFTWSTATGVPVHRPLPQQTWVDRGRCGCQKPGVSRATAARFYLGPNTGSLGLRWDFFFWSESALAQNVSAKYRHSFEAGGVMTQRDVATLHSTTSAFCWSNE